MVDVVLAKSWQKNFNVI